jgi:hypothetical protein
LIRQSAASTQTTRLRGGWWENFASVLTIQRRPPRSVVGPAAGPAVRSLMLPSPDLPFVQSSWHKPTLHGSRMSPLFVPIHAVVWHQHPTNPLFIAAAARALHSTRGLTPFNTH